MGIIRKVINAFFGGKPLKDCLTLRDSISETKVLIPTGNKNSGFIELDVVNKYFIKDEINVMLNGDIVAKAPLEDPNGKIICIIKSHNIPDTRFHGYFWVRQ